MLELMYEFITELIDVFPELIYDIPGFFIVPSLLTVSVVTVGELMLCRGKSAKDLYKRRIEKYITAAMAGFIATYLITGSGWGIYDNADYLRAMAIVTIVLFLPTAVIINLILSVQNFKRSLSCNSERYRDLSVNVLVLWAVMLLVCGTAAFYVLLDVYYGL